MPGGHIPEIPDRAKLDAAQAIKQLLEKRYGRAPTMDFVEGLRDAALDAIRPYVWLVDDPQSLERDRRQS